MQRGKHEFSDKQKKKLLKLPASLEIRVYRHLGDQFRVANYTSDGREYYLGLLIPRIARRLTSTASIVVPFN